jgi:hypothetical protein
MSGRRNQSGCGQIYKLIPSTLQSVALKSTLVQVDLGLQCFFLVTIHNNSFEHCAKNIKNLQNFEKCEVINTRCDIKKQHSPSEITDILI